MCITDLLSNALDAVSVVAALVALVVSLLALRAAQAQRRMASKEHAEFMRELRARANFEFRVRALNAPEEDLLERRRGALRTFGMIEVGLKNTRTP
jgi:L-lactate permease